MVKTLLITLLSISVGCISESAYSQGFVFPNGLTVTPSDGKVKVEMPGGPPSGEFLLAESISIPAGVGGETIVLPAGTKIEYEVPDFFFIAMDGVSSGRIHATMNADDYISSRTQEIQTLYKQFKTPGTSALSFSEFREKFNLLSNANESDFGYLWVAWLDSQTPIVTSEEFADLYRSLRRSIEKYDVTWETMFKPASGTNTRGDRAFSRRRLAFAKNKLLLRTSVGADKSSSSLSRIESYDGEFYRELLVHRGVMRGDVMPFNGRSRFFSNGDPLQQSMLLDSEFDLSNQGTDSDLASKQLYTLEKLVDFEGTECMPLMIEPRVQYFVDPARGFALIGILQDRYNFDPESKKIIESNQYSKRVLTDHKDLGNGLYLPLRTVLTWYKSGAEHAREDTHVTTLNVNSELADSEFSGIFPRGIFVHDSIRRVSYAEGYDPAVDKTIDIIVSPRTSRIRRILIATNILIVLALLFWRGRSWRQSRN